MRNVSRPMGKLFQASNKHCTDADANLEVLLVPYNFLLILILGAALLGLCTGCAGGTRGTGMPDSIFPVVGPITPNGFTTGLEERDGRTTANSGWPIARIRADCTMFLGRQKLVIRSDEPRAETAHGNPESCILILKEHLSGEALIDVQRKERGVPLRFEVYELDATGNRKLSLDTTKLGYRFVIPIGGGSTAINEQRFEAVSWEIEISEEIPGGARALLAIHRKPLTAND